jgi:hypothetical protein
MIPNLETTNRFLGIIAVASLVEMAGFLALSIALLLLIRRLRRLIDAVEEKHLAPASAQVRAILDDAGVARRSSDGQRS